MRSRTSSCPCFVVAILSRRHAPADIVCSGKSSQSSCDPIGLRPMFDPSRPSVIGLRAQQVSDTAGMRSASGPSPAPAPATPLAVQESDLATLVYLILCYFALPRHVFTLTPVLYTYLEQSRTQGSGEGVRKDTFKASDTPA